MQAASVAGAAVIIVNGDQNEQNERNVKKLTPDEEIHILDDLENKYGKKAYEMDDQLFTLYPLTKKTFEDLARDDVLQTIRKAKKFISLTGIWRATDRANMAYHRADYLV